MKNNRGVTLTSVMIYVLGMTIIIGLVATITSFFYKNINIEDINKDTTQYTKFSSIFLEEINKQNNNIIDYKEIGQDGISYIIFSTGNQYTFMKENNCIYKNKIKICENIESCSFSVTFVDSIYKIKVKLNTEIIGEQILEYNMSNY